jgi:hypothetical protein
MFISYKFKKFLDLKDGKDICEYELTDSEFGTVLGSGVWGGIWSDTMVAVIQEYSKRNLNVAANLAVCLVWQHKKYKYGLTIQQIIDFNKRNNPLFLQYEKDIQKYLALL